LHYLFFELLNKKGNILILYQDMKQSLFVVVDEANVGLVFDFGILKESSSDQRSCVTFHLATV